MKVEVDRSAAEGETLRMHYGGYRCWVAAGATDGISLRGAM